MLHTKSTILLPTFLTAITLWTIDATADSKLSFTRSTGTMVEVRLENDQPVAGLQFAIHSSRNISLRSIALDGRTTGSWMISSNNIDDSTMVVVLMRTGAENLLAGSGTIARLMIQTIGDAEGSYSLSFDQVVAATPAATSLSISAESLEWSDGVALFALGQNYPNPFNPSTTIPYHLNQPSRVNLTVYDIAGREITKISDGIVPAGEHSVSWTGTDESGAMVPSGVYFVRLQVDDKFDVRKMILAR